MRSGSIGPDGGDVLAEGLAVGALESGCVAGGVVVAAGVVLVVEPGMRHWLAPAAGGVLTGALLAPGVAAGGSEAGGVLVIGYGEAAAPVEPAAEGELDEPGGGTVDRGNKPDEVCPMAWLPSDTTSKATPAAITLRIDQPPC